MNLYSKIALLIVAGVGIGRAVAEMLGQLVYNRKHIIISQKKEQNKQFKISLEGTGDTPYKLTTPYITPYICYLKNPIKKLNPLQLLTLRFILP